MKTSLIPAAAALTLLSIASVATASAQYAGNAPPHVRSQSGSAPEDQAPPLDSDDYPPVVAYRFGDPALIPAVFVHEPAQQMVTAPVEGPDGRWIGRILAIRPGPDGDKADHIAIALDRWQSVWVNASDIQFDLNAKVAFSDLSREQLWQRLKSRD